MPRASADPVSTGHMADMMWHWFGKRIALGKVRNFQRPGAAPFKFDWHSVERILEGAPDD